METLIYLVTVMTDDECAERRTWGWYSTFDAAHEAVMSNHTDMFEYLYRYAVIEAAPQGIVPIMRGEWWYRADYPTEGGPPTVHETTKPEPLANTVNFGMG